MIALKRKIGGNIQTASTSCCCVYVVTAPRDNLFSGHHLDAISRKWLWNSGMDFHVYTGHGVGFVTHVVECKQCLKYFM